MPASSDYFVFQRALRHVAPQPVSKQAPRLRRSLPRRMAAASADSASAAGASRSAAAAATRSDMTTTTAAAPSAVDEDEPLEELLRRLRRRRRHLHFFKTQDDYIRCVNLGVPRPSTPRAEDFRMTDKEWRTAVETWVRELQHRGKLTTEAHRLEDRMHTITIVKNTIEYTSCSRPGVAQPTTPRADDPSISTRQWELDVQKWRRRLRERSTITELSS